MQELSPDVKAHFEANNKVRVRGACVYVYVCIVVVEGKGVSLYLYSDGKMFPPVVSLCWLVQDYSRLGELKRNNTAQFQVCGLGVVRKG